MHKHGISYKNLYKYNYINLFESVNGPSKPKYISYRNNNADFLINEYEKFSKTQSKFNLSRKNFKSFHKSLLHLKLSLNPKYKDNKYICYTERRSKKKKEIENFKNIYEKIFITNAGDTDAKNAKIKSKNHLQLITDYNTKTKSINNNDHLIIPSNTFIPYKKNKYLYILPDVVKEKVSDFVEEMKMMRTVKFINTIKVERQKKNNALMQLKFEETEIEMNSLKTSLKLLDIYKKCFVDYNKFLINEIKKEQKLLNEYNEYKKNLEDQVNILQKKFDDIMKEIEIVNNFKQIFTAIKNKKKMEDFSKQSKIYVEELKKKLKKQVFVQSKRRNQQRKKTSITKIDRGKKKQRKSIKGNSENNIQSLNENEKTKDIKKMFRRRSMSIITLKKDLNKKLERFNSYQPSNNEKKKKFETLINNDNLDYDIERNENLILNNILKLLNRYNKINSTIIDFKIQSEREVNSHDNLTKNILMNNQISDLNYLKAYNKSLTSKYKIVLYENNDYFLFFSIYEKINRMISILITYKLKNFNHIIDRFRELYDKNILFTTYKSMINDHKSKKLFLDKDIINYLYKALSLIEKIHFELMTKRNEYVNNTQFHDQIIEYENKMDMIKRVNNNREKRNKEIMRKQQIYNRAIEKSNKIIFKPLRKVSNDYPVHIRNKKNINNIEIENEDLLKY